MSGDELRSKALAEIEANEIDTFIKRRIPFVMRGWLKERLKRDDPVWEKANARVIVIPPESQAVTSAAELATGKELVEMTYHEVFDKITSEKNGVRYYVFGDYTPREIWQAIDWPKSVHGSTIYVTSGNTLSKAHFDFWNVFMIQIEGTKAWTLFSPSDYPFLYPVHKRASGEVRRCLLDLEHPDFEAYPLLKKATAYRTIAGPGDLLYLPPRWWHEVCTQSFSVSVNASLADLRSHAARESFSHFSNTLRARFIYRTSRHVAVAALLVPMIPARLVTSLEAKVNRFNDWRARRSSKAAA